jgi:hypothetical protein
MFSVERNCLVGKTGRMGERKEGFSSEFPKINSTDKGRRFCSSMIKINVQAMSKSEYYSLTATTIKICPLFKL